MLDPTMHRQGEPEILPGRKLAARVAGVFVAPLDHFVTRAVETLPLTFEGIEGDFHAGHTRRSGGREPWYPRGTEMRNERQLSIVAPDELAIVAERMGLAEIRPEWIGANLLLDGVPMLSMLPAGTMLFFKGGVTHQGRRPERALPACRALDRRACRHGRPRRRLAAVPQGGKAPARAGRLGREARHDLGGRGGFGARAGAVDLSGLVGGVLRSSSSSGSSRRVARQRVSDALIWSTTKKRAASRS